MYAWYICLFKPQTIGRIRNEPDIMLLLALSPFGGKLDRGKCCPKILYSKGDTIIYSCKLCITLRKFDDIFSDIAAVYLILSAKLFFSSAFFFCLKNTLRYP